MKKCLHFSPPCWKTCNKKSPKCQDIPLTGAKSCQDAAPCIYFNKLKPELFFPGVSFGCSLHLENRQLLSAETSVSGSELLWSKKMSYETFFSPFFSSRAIPKVTCVLLQEFKQEVFFSKRKGKWSSHGTAIQQPCKRNSLKIKL